PCFFVSRVLYQEIEKAGDAGEGVAKIVHHERNQVVLHGVERPQLRYLSRDKLLLRAQPGERLDAKQKLVPIKRLADEIVRARLQPGVAVALAVKRGQQDDGQVARLLAFYSPAE